MNAFETVRFLGDVGGWVDKYEQGLRLGGVYASHHRLPEGVCLVQLGDVVRLRPQFRESNEILARMSLEMMDKNPEGYKQLIGNHELRILKEWDASQISREGSVYESITRETHELVKEMVQRSYSVLRMNAEDGEWVASHAGVTRGYLAETRGYENLNGIILPDREGVIRGNEINFSADIYHADCNQEVMSSWLGYMGLDSCPRQIMGHSSPWVWRQNAWRSDISEWLRGSLRVNTEKKTVSLLYNNEEKFVFADPVWWDEWRDGRDWTGLLELEEISFRSSKNFHTELKTS